MQAASELAGTELERAIAAVYRLTGVAMAPEKRSMLQGRLRSRMKVLQIESFAEYLDRVERFDDERRCFVDVVTTHQTQFFRTPRVWQYLADTFVPGWQRTCGPQDTLRAWSAAASTGEEAYSLAMLFEEHRQPRERQGLPFDYRILATDISAGVLQTAVRGEYAGTSALQFQAAWPERHRRFNADPTGLGFHAAPQLRQRLRFEPCNLLGPAWPDAGEFDLVLLRNVLIYFKAGDARDLLVRVARRMRPGATLVIGESESLNGLDLPLRFVEPQIYRLPP